MITLNMELVKCDNSQTLPYELIELVMKYFTREFLAKLYIQSTKYNPNLACHIKVVFEKMQPPVRVYLTHIFNTISLINTRVQYANTISTLHELKIIDNKEKENRTYKNILASNIKNPREQRKFKNLTGCVGKYCE